MLNNSLKLIAALILSIAVFSCSDKPKPEEMGELKDHENKIFKFSVKYPSNWTSDDALKTFTSFSNSAARSRFRKYDSDGVPVAKIYVSVETLDSNNTIDKVIERKSSIFGPEFYNAPEKLTIDGVQATKLSYGFPLNDGDFKGEYYIAAKDTGTVTILQLEAFGGSFETYKEGFDKVVNSLVLATTPPKRSATGDTVYMSEELPFPSETLKSVNGPGWTIKIPDNFKQKKPGFFDGERRGDCTILVRKQSLGKNKNLKKIVELSTKALPNAKSEATKLNGVEAYKVEYNASKTVKRRMYYLIGGENLYQLSIDWFVGEEAQYLPIFEKSVNTFKVK